MRVLLCAAMFAWLMLLASNSLAGDAPGPAPDPAGLELQLQLPDGLAWTLGDGGVGRPFMARLLLINNGKNPIRTWFTTDPEGAQCPYVTLTDEQGHVTKLVPPPTARLAGVPGVFIIQPTQVVPIELELLRLIGDHGLPPGKYKIQAFYENALKNEPPFVPDPVWTGKIHSAVMDMTIAPPKLNPTAPGH